MIPIQHFGNGFAATSGSSSVIVTGLNTALAVMILETLYRFMPLYREIQ